MTAMIYGGEFAQLRVTTIPPGAALTCDGVLQRETPVTVSGLGPGRHLLIARKDGFREARHTVSLMSGQEAAVEIKLERIYGLLLLQSSPTGASVAVDGAYRGITPLLVPDFPLGQHRIQFSAEGYIEKSVDITLDDRTPRKVSVNLVSDTARLSLRSEPAGASVMINGSARGTTPCTIEGIPSGEVRIGLRLSGYRPYQEKAVLHVGETHEVDARLEAMPGALVVQTMPPGARVYIDNQYRGDSPLTLENLEPGTYRVRVESPGYAPDARDVSIESTGSTVEEFRLTRNSGALVLVTQPAGVNVYLDGKFAGATQPADAGEVSRPFKADLLSEGVHRVQLTKPGYVAKNKRVQISAKQVVNLHEELDRRFIPDIEVRVGEGEGKVFRGVLVREHENGDLEVEVKPKIIMTIKAEEIIHSSRIHSPLDDE